MTHSEALELYSRLPIPQFLDLILARNKDSKMALFYLLRYRMHNKLKSVLKRSGLFIEMCDVHNDFFIYLCKGPHGDDERAYYLFENVRDAESLEAFILKTFRNYLLNRLDQEKRNKEAIAGMQTSDKYDTLKDMQIHCLGLSIAWADETFPLIQRLIFYRSLAYHLHCRDQYTNEQVAMALNLTYDNYRQIDSRNKAAIRQLVKRLMQGGPLSLDSSHEQLAARLESQYDDLAPIVKKLYRSTIDQLSLRDVLQAKKLEHDQLCHQLRIDHITDLPPKTPKRKPTRSREVRLDLVEQSVKQRRWNSFMRFLDIEKMGNQNEYSSPQDAISESLQ